MRLGVLIFAFLLAAWSLGMGAHAQIKDQAVEESFFEFFNKTCMLNMPRLDKVRAAARLFDWKPITGDAALMLGPADPRSPFEGWAAPHDGRTVFVALSEGVLEGRKVVICTSTERRLDQEAFVKVIESSSAIRRAHDEVENMQRYRGWTGQINGEAVLIHLTTMAKDQISAGTLAVIAPAPR